MRLFKPAANRETTKAMVEMGALYSAGLYTPHDLPTAYRWFAMALRKEPDNQLSRQICETLGRDDATGAAAGDQTEPVQQTWPSLSGILRRVTPTVVADPTKK